MIKKSNNGKAETLSGKPFLKSFRVNVTKTLTNENLIGIGSGAVGHYLTLRCFCCMNGSIPKNIEPVSALLGMNPANIESIYKSLISLFIDKNDGRLYDPELEKIRKRKKASKHIRSNAASIAANARWQKFRDRSFKESLKDKKHGKEINEVWEYFIEKMEKQTNYLFTIKRRRLIRKALERGWTVSDLIKAINYFYENEEFKRKCMTDLKHVLRVHDGVDMIGNFLNRKPGKK